MVAPKNWGYTREKPIGDELLVSWADGDLTKILDKELVERLLTHPEERRRVAAYARCAQDTTEPATGPDRIVWPRRGLTDLVVRIGNPDVAPMRGAPLPSVSGVRIAGRAIALPSLSPGTIVGVALAVGFSAVLIAWMVRHL